MKLKNIFYLFLLISIYFFSCQQNNFDKKDIWEQYEFAVTIEDELSAMYFLNQIIQVDSNDIQAKEKLANIYFKNNNYEAVYLLLKNIKSANKKILAESMLHLNKKDEAKILLEEILKVDTKGDLDSRYKLIALLKEKKDYPAALKVLNEITEINKSKTLEIEVPSEDGEKQKTSYYAAAHNTAGIIFFELKEYDKAKSHFEEALKDNPNFYSPKFNLEEIKKIKNNEK